MSVLQGGEDAYLSDEGVCGIIRKNKSVHPDCAVTLSLGERTRESYAALREVGADRYLLRHGTANKAHYEHLHPPEMSFDKWLWDYVRNVQPIFTRVDDTEGASLNNRIVVNYAAAISRSLLAYTFPKWINYLSRSDNTEYRNFVTVLNKKMMMMMKSGNAAVREMKWYRSVCGHAYLYVNHDKKTRHGVPFMIQNVCPWSAYVVYSAFDVYRPVYSVIEYDNKKCIFTSAKLYEVDNKY